MPDIWRGRCGKAPQGSASNQDEQGDKAMPLPEKRFFVRKSVPLSEIDLENRRAAATGSPRYAAAASGADFNGHCLEIRFNPHKSHWSAHYYWGEFVWLAHGTLERCLAVCTRRCDETDQRGTCIVVDIEDGGNAPESVEVQVELCRSAGLEEVCGSGKDAVDFAYSRGAYEPETAGGPEL